jgi:hypothetical protein
MAVGEIVAVHSVILLEMTDDGFDGGAAFHLSFDDGRHTALLPGCVDFELVIWRRVVASVSGIGVEPIDRPADKLLDRRDDASQGMAVIRIARQRLHMGDELAALAVLEGSGNADLDAELVRLVRLPCRCTPLRAHAGCRSWARVVRAPERVRAAPSSADERTRPRARDSSRSCGQCPG